MAATVTVVEEAEGRTALAERHVQRGPREGLVQALGKGPTDHLAAVQIEHDGQEEPAFRGLAVSHIHAPDFVRLGGWAGRRVRPGGWGR